MMLHNWIYVSVGKIEKRIETAELRKIVATSIGRNSVLGITGALLFTGVRFAQCVEGAEGAVAIIRDRIERDRRHEAIITLVHGPIAERSFRDWALAFAGPSPYVSRTLNRALREMQEGHAAAGTSVQALLLELAAKTASVEQPAA